jgi:hypothetical protein
MKRIFSRLGLFFGALFTQLFLCSSVFATMFTPPASDVSIGYLGKIFGGVGSILIGPSQTILGIIYNSFNAGVLTIGGLILTYSTARAIVDTAHDGEPMGKKISQWIIMRTAVGVGVLVPNAISGYSMLQVTMLWIVVQGIGLADIIWNQTLDYLHKGGVIYAGAAAGSGQVPYLEKILAIGGNDINAGQYNTSLDQYVGSMSVMRANACMIALQDALDAHKKALKKDMEDNKSNYVTGSSDAQKFVNSSIVLHWQINTVGDQSVISFPGNIAKNEILGLSALNGACGQFRWTWNSDPKTSSGVTGNDRSYWQAKEDGLRGMVSTTDAAAHDAIRYVRGKLILDSDVIDNNASINVPMVNTLVDAAAQYQSRINAMRIAKANDYNLNPGAQTTFDEFYKDAKARGWASAGAYYYELIKVQRRSFDSTYYQIWSDDSIVPNSVAITNYPLKAALRLAAPVATSSIDVTATTTLKRVNDILATSFSQVFSWTRGGGGAEVFKKELLPLLRWNNDYLHSEVKSQIDLFNAAQKEPGGITGLSLDVLKSGVKVPNVASWAGPLDQSRIVLDPLNTNIGLVLKDWNSIMMNATTPEGMGAPTYIGSPIEKLYYLGQSMITHAVDIWRSIMSTLFMIGAIFQGINTLGAAIVSIFAPGTFWGTTAGAQAVGSTIISLADFAYKLIEMSVHMMMPLVLTVTGLLFTTGITLGIYVPLIPYMLFTFGIISWLVFVIEAMAAAPIVALGLMDPKSGADELLGRAEPAQMLLLAVFLRPSVMLIGLITGTILSYVGVNVLNSTFGSIINSIDMLKTTDTAIIIKEVGILFVYTFIMLALVNKCYETIYSIPDQIMQWIGAHTRASTDQQLLGEVKQGLGQVGQAGGEAGRGVGERAGQGIQAGRLTPGYKTPSPKEPKGGGAEATKGGAPQGGGGQSSGGGQSRSGGSLTGGAKTDDEGHDL